MAQISLEGYKTEELYFDSTLNGAFWGNFLFFSGFWIGMLVDWNNGRAFDIIPNHVAINLVPDDSRVQTVSITKPLDDKAYDLVLRVRFSNESWFPLSKQEMTDAAKDKLLERLSESGRFHFVGNTNTDNDNKGYLNIDISLIESIQTVKLTATLQIPNGATFIASGDDTLSNKESRAIYDTFSSLGKKVADNLFKKLNGRI